MVSGGRPWGAGVAGEPVGGGEDAAEVVGGVAPLGGEPGVVVVEPAYEGADREGGLDGVELEVGAGDAGAFGDDGAGDDGSEEPGAGGVFEGFEAAAEGVEEAVAGGLVGEGAGDLVVEDIVGDVCKDLVGLWAFCWGVAGHGSWGTPPPLCTSVQSLVTIRVRCGLGRT